MIESAQENRPGPGRPRQFDEAQALEAALRQFRHQGYASTSLDDLTSAMEISRSSFYAAFGSKHAVLMAALQAHSQHVLDTITPIAAVPGPASAMAMLERLSDPKGDPRGCLLMNTVTELAPSDPEVAALGRAHIERVAGLLARTLAGEGEAPAEDRARALVSLALGVLVLRKAGLPAAEIAATLDEARLLIAARA